MNFENVIVRGDYATRFIMSWVNVGGNFDTKQYWKDGGYTGLHGFKKWLASIGLTDKEIADCVDLATNGRLEYETSAIKFMEKQEVLDDIAVRAQK